MMTDRLTNEDGTNGPTPNIIIGAPGDIAVNHRTQLRLPKPYITRAILGGDPECHMLLSAPMPNRWRRFLWRILGVRFEVIDRLTDEELVNLISDFRNASRVNGHAYRTSQVVGPLEELLESRKRIAELENEIAAANLAYDDATTATKLKNAKLGAGVRALVDSGRGVDVKGVRTPFRFGLLRNSPGCYMVIEETEEATYDEFDADTLDEAVAKAVEGIDGE